MDYTKKHILKILRNRAFCQRTAELRQILPPPNTLIYPQLPSVRHYRYLYALVPPFNVIHFLEFYALKKSTFQNFYSKRLKRFTFENLYALKSPLFRISMQMKTHLYLYLLISGLI